MAYVIPAGAVHWSELGSANRSNIGIGGSLAYVLRRVRRNAGVGRCPRDQTGSAPISRRREECLVEGFNKATGQWIGRTSQNKTLNFLWPAAPGGILGKYVEVDVTRAGPHSLAGEAVN